MGTFFGQVMTYRGIRNILYRSTEVDPTHTYFATKLPRL